MEHHFDIDIATEYGLLEAILLDNFYFWVEKNRANDVNFHDGYYWTYNSTKAIAELFPYVSEYQIRRALKHLESEGLMLTGNYNETAYDRTTWYALTEKGLAICQKRKMDLSKTQNGFGKIDTPIPYTNTDTKQIRKNIPTVYKKEDCQEVADMYNEICVSLPKCMKLSDTRISHIKATLKVHSMDELRLAFQKAEASDFCTGRDGKGSRKWCNLEWMMKSENNLLKLLEGNYDNQDSVKEETIADMRKITQGMTPEEYEEMERKFR